MKFIVKKQYLYIYISLITIFTIFYLVLFCINRMQYLNKSLDDNREKLVNMLNVAEGLTYLANEHQLSHFIDYASLLEHFYKNDKSNLKFMLDKNTIYDFIAITDLEGNYKFKSNQDFKFKFNIKDIFDKDSTAIIVAFDKESRITYKIFTYPIMRNDKIDSYVVAYLKVDFLSDFDDVYLVSQNGYLLNESSINDIGMDYKNISFLYPDEWESIIHDENGQFISKNGIFTYLHLNLNKMDNIKDIKVKQNLYYLISIIPINPDDNPYFIRSISSFVKYVNFKINITYWIIGYIWVFCTSIIVLMMIINRIKNSQLASLDDMTGAYNRRSGYARINKLIKEFSDTKIKRYFTHIIARFLYFRKPIDSIHLCMVDIDGLKQVNDNLGHKYGDELIVTIVDCIKRDLRKSEILIRMGGDEFLIIFLNRSFSDIDNYWRDILQRFYDKNNSGNFKYTIKASHGVAEYKLGMDIENCIVQADELMYKEKRRHKVNLFFN